MGRIKNSTKTKNKYGKNEILLRVKEHETLALEVEERVSKMIEISATTFDKPILTADIGALNKIKESIARTYSYAVKEFDISENDLASLRVVDLHKVKNTGRLIIINLASQVINRIIKNQENITRAIDHINIYPSEVIGRYNLTDSINGSCSDYNIPIQKVIDGSYDHEDLYDMCRRLSRNSDTDTYALLFQIDSFIHMQFPEDR